MSSSSAGVAAAASTPPRQHGVKGVYYGGDWLDIEDCQDKFLIDESKCSGSSNRCVTCPRSASANSNNSMTTTAIRYDVLIVGAGCIGAAIARELSKYALRILWVEAADDVSQGATKGNSGIVHAGYDDTPNTNRAKYCWPGNQMFCELDRQLRFGYQKNGSLVLAVNDMEVEHLSELLERGRENGVKNLRIINDIQELRRMEPYLNPNVKAALYAPDAGNVIPYEFTVALAENAVDNGVELRIRRQVKDIKHAGDDEEKYWQVTMQHWEPKEYVEATAALSSWPKSLALAVAIVALAVALPLVSSWQAWYLVCALLLLTLLLVVANLTRNSSLSPANKPVTRDTPLAPLVKVAAGLPNGKAGAAGDQPVSVSQMLVGGSGSAQISHGVEVATETVQAKFVINCAGGASDQIARMIGDTSFTIQPRLGDYLLLNRNQGHLARNTLFPCPDPVLGKGVLVQTTLWGNLILGPTARDMYKPEARDMSPAAIQEYILTKCRQLVPSFDPKETFHAFCGARAKSTRGDWIIEQSAQNPRMIHVAGIDSPGLAGSPAIAMDVVKMLQQGGLQLNPNPTFNPNRAPIIAPKPAGMRGLKMTPIEKMAFSNGNDETAMAQNIICKCEKVTELEVVRALRRSLPIDSTQAIRKRTRAGMGHCQGDADNYNCEARVRAIIARENGVPLSHVGIRPWPATSTLPQRWITDSEKQVLIERMNSN